MASLELKYFSHSLDMATAAHVILPEEQGGGPFAVMYLLHGLRGDHSVWQRLTSIDRYVRNLPLIVVMPNAGRTFYCDAILGAKMETAIISDLVPYIDAVFNTAGTRERRCIGGLSMGGYGAIKLALKHPELFCSAVSHSGALGFAHHPISQYRTEEFQIEFARVIGHDAAGGPNDLHALAERLPVEQRPMLRIDCGVADLHIEDNRSLHSHLDRIGFGHEYEEHPGDHNWDYWDLHVREAIAFHARDLGVVSRQCD